MLSLDTLSYFIEYKTIELTYLPYSRINLTLYINSFYLVEYYIALSNTRYYSYSRAS